MPVPSDVRHASEARRLFIRRQERESLVGTIEFGTPRRPIEPERAKRRTVGSPLREPIDLRRPAPPTWRPQTASGATSFHFALTPVSKTRAAETTGSGTGGAAPDRAAGYERYVSSPEKVEVDRPAGYDRYIDVDKHRSDEAGSDTRADLLRTNISIDRAEREAFWTAAWASARTPHIPSLELRPENGSAADWMSIADDATTPRIVADAARQIARERVAAAAGEPDGEAVASLRIGLIEPEAIRWAEGLGARFGRRRAARTVHYRKPRGGHVQQQLVAELPMELGREHRREILDAMADDFERLGVRYTIVVHEPDHTNDARNWHLHAIWYPGPSRRRDDGSWDFMPTPGSGKLRRGDMHDRLAGLVAPERGKAPNWDRATADTSALRVRYAEHCNRQLESCGAPRRYDPRRYEQMGIEQDAASHLGTDAARLVGAGLSVDIDHENARKGWDGERRRIESRAEQRNKDHAATVTGIDAVLATAAEGPHRARLARLRSDFIALAATIEEGVHALDTLAMEDAEARSAAERLKGNMIAMLVGIRKGKASAADIRNRSLIERRLRLAEDHLREINQAAAPWGEGVCAYREEVQAAGDRLVEIEAEIREVSALVRAVSAARPSSSGPGRAGRSDETEVPARHDTEPSLFARFNELRERLRSAEPPIPVLLGNGRFEAIGLTRQDEDVLTHPELLERAQSFLAAVHQNQGYAVSRLLRFVEEHGLDHLTAGTRRDGRKAPQGVCNLHRDYARHPRFLAEVREAERVYEASEAARQPVAAPPSQRAQEDRSACPPSATAQPACLEAGENASKPDEAVRRSAVEGPEPRDSAGERTVPPAPVLPVDVTVPTEAETAADGAGRDRGADGPGMADVAAPPVVVPDIEDGVAGRDSPTPAQPGDGSAQPAEPKPQKTSPSSLALARAAALRRAEEEKERTARKKASGIAADRSTGDAVTLGGDRSIDQDSRDHDRQPADGGAGDPGQEAERSATSRSAQIVPPAAFDVPARTGVRPSRADRLDAVVAALRRKELRSARNRPDLDEGIELVVHYLKGERAVVRATDTGLQVGTGSDAILNDCRKLAAMPEGLRFLEQAAAAIPGQQDLPRGWGWTTLWAGDEGSPGQHRPRTLSGER